MNLTDKEKNWLGQVLASVPTNPLTPNGEANRAMLLSIVPKLNPPAFEAVAEAPKPEEEKVS